MKIINSDGKIIKQINIHEAIFSLVGSSFSALGDEITYKSGQTPPSDAEIDAEMIRLQAEYDAQEYARNRATAFPTWQEQMDMQYHDEVNGTTTWKDVVEAVKTKWPKNNTGPV